jgi:hypothetical protein
LSELKKTLSLNLKAQEKLRSKTSFTQKFEMT